MMTLDDAARELGISVPTLKRWRRLGCPCTPGRRGRGHAALYDPEAIRAWRAAHGREAALLEIATAAPGVLADAALDAFNQIDAPDKRRQAGLLAGTWYILTTALLDHLRTTCAEVPELAGVPEPVERLRKIAAT